MKQLKEVPGLYDAILKNIKQKQGQLQKELDKIDDLLQIIQENKQESGPTFEVTLRSRWSSEGESDVTSTSKKGLQKAIRKAQKLFKTKNNRSDIQADYSVKVRFGEKGEFSFSVPKKHYKDLI